MNIHVIVCSIFPVNIDECEGVVCNNGGTCNDGVNAYTCACVSGFEGDHCEGKRYSSKRF